MKATQKVHRTSQFPQGGWRVRDNTMYSSFKRSKQARKAVKRYKQCNGISNATKALSEALRAL
ncbi:UNVERIFIED_ORG: hypothetical protein GCAPEGMB_00477 [Vibrio phage V07]